MNRDEILKALEVVIDPELRRSIVELEMVRSIEISPNGVVDVTVSLTTAGCPIRGHFQASVAEAVATLEGCQRHAVRRMLCPCFGPSSPVADALKIADARVSRVQAGGTSGEVSVAVPALRAAKRRAGSASRS